MKDLPAHYTEFMTKYPELGAAYRALGDASLNAGPLDHRCAELVKVGISVGARLESAVKSHCRKALGAGATEDEIRHAVMLSVTTVGFPTMMAALRWAQDVFDRQAKAQSD